MKINLANIDANPNRVDLPVPRIEANPFNPVILATQTGLIPEGIERQGKRIENERSSRSQASVEGVAPRAMCCLRAIAPL